jgi:hypothetical protein
MHVFIKLSRRPFYRIAEPAGERIAHVGSAPQDNQGLLQKQATCVDQPLTPARAEEIRPLMLVFPTCVAARYEVASLCRVFLDFTA